MDKTQFGADDESESENPEIEEAILQQELYAEEGLEEL